MNLAQAFNPIPEPTNQQGPPLRDITNNFMDSLNQTGRSITDTVEYLRRLGFEERK